MTFINILININAAYTYYTTVTHFRGYVSRKYAGIPNKIGGSESQTLSKKSKVVPISGIKVDLLTKNILNKHVCICIVNCQNVLKTHHTSAHRGWSDLIAITLYYFFMSLV